MAIFGIRISARVLKQGLLVLGLLQLPAAWADNITYRGTFSAQSLGSLYPTGACMASTDAKALEACVTSYITSHGPYFLADDWFPQDQVPCNVDSAVECNTADFAQAGNPSNHAIVDMHCLSGGAPSLPDGTTYPNWCVTPYTGQAIPPPATCPSGADLATGQCINPGDKNAGPTCNCDGDPINPGSGDHYEIITDYKGGGPFPLVFRRSYNSIIANQTAGSTAADQSLGAGWTSDVSAHLSIYVQPETFFICTDSSNHEQYICPTITEDSIGSVTVWHGDGSQQVFTGELGLDGEVDSALSPESGSTGQLTYSNGTFTYARADGYEELYNAAGQLTAVQDPQGLQQTYIYTYATGGALQSITVTDPAGRTMVVNYDTTGGATNGLVLSLSVPSLNSTSTTPSSIYYGYLNGNLQTVTYQDSSVVTYEYSDTALPHAMTGLKDEDGNEFAAWSYNDTSGKATCSEHAPSGNAVSTAITCFYDTSGVDKTTITYNSDGSADVTEATGLVRHLTFQDINGRYELYTASAPGVDGREPVQTITYDSNGDGFIASTTDFPGHDSAGAVTLFNHDTAGRETLRTEASGTTYQRTTTTTWNALVSMPEEIDVYDAGGALKRKETYCYNASAGACSDSTAIGSVWTHDIHDPVTGTDRITTYTYSSGFLASVDGPRTDVSDVTTFTYSADILHTITNALSQPTTISSYTASGLPLTIVDPNQITTTLTYL